ncbi:helix-turn-helix domain-containing protein [Streptacidiphilus sp. P02-A3a]|uniref:helix-turn-helix domain-containing protein n=1 Tax=Streptacidiphilus sp. P02-A3a TaxID=2704468 RepID=UPI0015F85B3D|nr:helix-turn-helix domain-containing protein [Streptacidiphilus sp. P02-A3a]QMU69457.1 AraC family transcriptional regulator [Streptacidiphilus sp. P02-A3a]
MPSPVPAAEPQPDGSELAVDRAGAALSGYVLGYQGFRIGAIPQQRARLVVPDGSVNILFGFGSPVRVTDAVRPQLTMTAVSMVSPVALTAVLGEHTGGVHCLVAVLTPLGAYRLFGVPMNEWSGLHLDPADLFGRRLPHLREQLAECPGWPERFRLLDRLFARQILDGPECRREVVWAWAELQRSGGRVPIQRLAAATGWSRRHLERRFREQVGRSPKDIAQIRRLQEALRLQEAGVPLAHLATRAGFHDQPHFNRAFKAMMGFSPLRLPADRVDWGPNTLLRALPAPTGPSAPG